MKFQYLVTQQQVVYRAGEQKHTRQIDGTCRQYSANRTGRYTLLSVRQVTGAIRSGHNTRNGREEDANEDRKCCRYVGYDLVVCVGSPGLVILWVRLSAVSNELTVLRWVGGIKCLN